MRLFAICLATIAVLLSALPSAHARGVEQFSYQRLFDKSDLIVIAEATSKTADTTESAFFSDMVSEDRFGHVSKVPAIGVETPFKILKVIKGDPNIGQFILHHYREASQALMVDGPMVVTFDPADPKAKKQYLLFLVREQDGRFAPYGGQTDPYGRSIISLDAWNN